MCYVLLKPGWIPQFLTEVICDRYNIYGRDCEQSFSLKLEGGGCLITWEIYY